jgi:CRP/FNR family cyclic AMP-dependent transcriptional regulator
MVALSLFRNAETKQYAAGDTIFSTGDEGELMYVVAEGEVEIWVGPVLAEVVTAGGIFGEMALIDHRVRSADAVAQSDCKLILLNQSRFEYLVREAPNFALQVMSIMAERLRHTNDRLIKS